MNWIDINKSKPGYGERVMFCVEGDQTQSPPPRQATMGRRISTNKDGEVFDVTGYVTHWAPEPELPAQ